MMSLLDSKKHLSGGIAENRLAPMLRLGLSIWAGTLEKYSRNRRLATLLVLFQYLERDAVDDAPTVFDQLMQKNGLGAQRRLRKERLRTLNDLDTAALTLRDVVRLILDSSIAPGKIQKLAFEQFGEAKLLHAITQVSEFTSVMRSMCYMTLVMKRLRSGRIPTGQWRVSS